ncbi:TPA: hypothetical protein ACNSTW_002260 [Acinetobacter baumannii]|uniref:hypothetical protein n=3 Tax=Acinetobacter baumannii TaxID=470 RepID=UPI00028CF440|nr:hypothetical protein [Acinetobacter baumannii]EKK06257.1 hypothetical protein ACINNAV72_0142 [Acinetobacter baumannii Naval-72]EKU5629265.1 hypothetical protein [Acinetobacter baumannii]EKV1635929.1 hypothetical protein [Acinetobacter baumannii]EKW8164332.1 hypothetical protein [Acinetobacter baumannii]MCT9254733.1 hypothetical protein [Acinetobacter baumannii]
MNSFINLIIEDNKFFYAAISFLFLCLFFFFYLLQYIYISYNLKGICKIIFSDESHFTLPLEPFNCFFISVLPIVFWREILNIKKEINFKKLYGKEFYYPMSKSQLNKMLNQYPKFFLIQYIIYLSVILWAIFMIIACILIKFF